MKSPWRWEPHPRWSFGRGRLSPGSFALLSVPLQENNHLKKKKEREKGLEKQMKGLVQPNKFSRGTMNTTTPQESLTNTQEDRKRHKWEDKDPTSINGMKRGFETCWTLITVQVWKTQIQPTPPSWLCLLNAHACFLVPSVQWMQKNLQSSSLI